jgi:hypothetical protein
MTLFDKIYLIFAESDLQVGYSMLGRESLCKVEKKV